MARFDNLRRRIPGMKPKRTASKRLTIGVIATSVLSLLGLGVAARRRRRSKANSEKA
jgi:hypothetical protein